MPIALGAFGTRIKPSFAENVHDGRSRNFANAELTKFAKDACVAPTVLASQAKDEFANVGFDIGPPW